jgi:hypothetical protein
MRKENTLQTNFAAGELSPRLMGRTDIEKFANGAEILENFTVRDAGNIDRRLGSEYHALAAAQGETNVVRTVEFIFSRTQAIIIEISRIQVPVLPV